MSYEVISERDVDYGRSGCEEGDFDSNLCGATPGGRGLHYGPISTSISCIDRGIAA